MASRAVVRLARSRVAARAARFTSTCDSKLPYKRYGAEDPIERERVWTDMSDKVQETWGKLGWQATNWSTGTPTPTTEYEPWSQLTETEKKAAAELGYTEEIWNLEDESDEGLFDLHHAMIPSEVIVGFVGVLFVFGLACSSAAHGALKDHECVQHYDDHHDKH